MNMKHCLTKKVKTTRTYKYKITNVNQQFIRRFEHIQAVRKLYFNYGLKYLYQHYGVAHLTCRFPKKVQQKNFLVRKMCEFARDKALVHDINLKDEDYSVQSIEKMLMELITAFDSYRTKQFRLRYWSKKQTAKYLREHNCNLTGYGRINYKHSLDDLTSATFKQNKHYDQKHKRTYHTIELINNYAVKIPYFGVIQVKESLTSLKHKELAEATVIKRDDGSFELQLKYKMNKQKHLTKENLANIAGLDVNSADNQLYVFNDGRVDGLPKKLIDYLKTIDQKARKYNHYLDQHKHNVSNKVKRIRQTYNRLLAKISNLITDYQWYLAKLYAKLYLVLAMEDLHSFNMRVSDRMKNKYKRKNINHKLAFVKPGTFKKQMIVAYENTGSLLFTVNPFDTSKQCSTCGYVYKDLEVGQKHWLCPQCHTMHNRDHNSTIDIIDFTVHPEHHPILNEKRYAYLTPDDLVQAF